MNHGDYTKINFGTAVTRKILDNLNSPDDRLKIIHIAGTNGKGSTAEYFTRILIAAGKKVGTFTSPAVYDFYDQFRIDGEVFPAAEKYFKKAETAAAGLNATDFEIQTAGILLAFCEEGCEYAVIECGMGGLYDATNAVNKKVLAVITSISLEHTAYLGGTVEEICAHKAGIIKNCPAVVNAYQPAEARKYFEKLGGIFAEASGGVQSFNAATAVVGARLLGIDENCIARGIENARLSGRMEEFNAEGVKYILDGAHNPAAFVPLSNFLKGLAGEKIIIFGCLADKDIEGNLSALAGICDKIIAVKCNSPRARSLEQTAEACKKYFKTVQTAQSVSDALSFAFAKTVVVCGSFTLLREAKEWIEKKR